MTEAVDWKPRVGALYAHLPWKRRQYFRMKWRRGEIFTLCERLTPRQGLVIDIGCGTGIVSNLLNLAGPERHVIGIDLDAARIAVAQSTIGMRQGVEFRLQALQDMPETAADAVVVVDVIHHLSLALTQELFRRVHGMLKPGGVFILKDIDRRPRWKFWMNYCLDTWNTLRSFTLGSDLVFREPAAIQAELEALGFRVTRPPVPTNSTCPHALYVCTKTA